MKLKFRAVRLIPRGPFTEIPQADTLFGAIATGTAVLFGSEAVEELVEAFRDRARISSAFPFYRGTYYLPKPLSVELVLESIFERMPENERYTAVKKLKKAGYIDVENFENALRLKPFRAPGILPYSTIDLPKVSLDRVTENSDLYFWREVRFRKGGGLYFLYSGDGGIFRDYIEPALRYLADTGLGGKATWGFGLFEPAFDSIEINVPNSSYSVTLSNALPNKTPVLWRILKKGGWSFGRRKPKMTFIIEGSIVKDDNGRIESIDIGLPFKVHIYGLTFPIPALLPEGLK